jgi:hypothetical protein
MTLSGTRGRMKILKRINRAAKREMEESDGNDAPPNGEDSWDVDNGVKHGTNNPGLGDIANGEAK